MSNPIIIKSPPSTQGSSGTINISDVTDLQSELDGKASVNHTHQTYLYNQVAASSLWTIDHNLNKYPSVTVVDSSGNEVIGEVQYMSTNQIIITFTAPFSGTAQLN